MAQSCNSGIISFFPFYFHHFLKAFCQLEIQQQIYQLIFGKTIKSISTWGLHIRISYTDNTTIKCIGLGKFGALGQDDTLQRGELLTTTFPKVSISNLGLGGRKFVGVYSGWYHTWILLENDVAKCWGIHYHVQSGTKSNKAVGIKPCDIGQNLAKIELISPT